MKHKPLNQRRQLAIIFAEMKGQILKYLTMDKPQRSAEQTRHERETLKRRQITERPPMKTKPNPVQLPKRY